MTGLLPPLRLTGGQVLRDGVLQVRSIAIACGRITRGPLPAVDMTGYLVLPGVIDMLARPGDGPGGPDWVLEAQDRLGASQGVTTQYLCQGWSWEGGRDSPAAAERMAEMQSRIAPHLTTDLRLMLRIEHALAQDTARLGALMRRHDIGLAMFSDRAGAARALAETNPAGFAALAGRLDGVADAAALRLQLDLMLAGAPRIPRALCDLAEAFDAAGIVYGSMEDGTAEAREHHSMIGAGICMAPRSHRVAAAARAVSDPVVIPLRDLLDRGRAQPFPGPRGPSCDALVSDGAPASLAMAALSMADTGAMGLAEAWALISETPARILRLTDRGRLDHGMRADLTIVNARTRQVEATIAGGRLAYLAQEAGARFLGASGPVRTALAAE